MWTVIAIVSVPAAVAVVVVLSMARSRDVPKRLDQQQIAHRHPEEFPEPGSADTPHRPDGSLMPGSQEYRNRNGRP